MAIKLWVHKYVSTERVLDPVAAERGVPETLLLVTLVFYIENELEAHVTGQGSCCDNLRRGGAVWGVSLQQ